VSLTNSQIIIIIITTTTIIIIITTVDVLHVTLVLLFAGYFTMLSVAGVYGFEWYDDIR
jgi:hypothetical protein